MSIEVNATEQIIEVNATGSTIDINVTSQTVDVNATTSVIDVNVTNGPGPGVPSAGLAGQVLKKLSNADYDTYWAADTVGVPYVGATGNVDLGEFELKAGQIEFDQTPTGTAGVAVTRWNDTVGTIETTLKGGNVILRHGRDMFERVVNKTGIQLTKAAYQAVKISDAQGQRLAVELAQANNDNNSADTIGLVVETIDNNQEGYIYTVGELQNINTTGSLQGETWADGDVLYLSPTTAGRITNVKPVAPQHLVVIGYVVYAHQNNGKIFVKITNGFELGELHDVDTTGATSGQVLTYNGTIWTPQTNAAGNIYNTDGTLTGNRTVTMGSNTLSFTKDLLVNGITVGIGNIGDNTRYNTVLGWRALFNPTSKSRNTAIGSESLTSATTGSFNTAVGNESLYALTTGTENTAIGDLGLDSVTTGAGNVSLGAFAMRHLVTGNYNIGIGYDTNLGVDTTAGSYNTLLGAQSTIGDTSGSNNTVIGARINASGNYSNNIILGDGSGNMRLVFNSSGDAILGGSTTYPTFSGFKLDVLGSGRFSGNLTTNVTANSIVKTNASGVLTAAIAGTDYQLPITNPITGTGASGQVAYWSGTNTQTGDNNLIWNSASIRLGIGRTPSARRFEIQQATGSTAASIGLYGGGSSLVSIIGVESTSTNDLQLASTTGIRFYTGSTLGNIVTDPTNERMRIFSSTGNLLLQNGGTFTDSGQRLQVQGDAFIRGSGNTSATTALTVQNSDGTNALRVRNDGVTLYGSAGAYISPMNRVTSISISGEGLLFNATGNTAGTDYAFAGNNITATTGALTVVGLFKNFLPTSGNATYTNTLIQPIINQTGGANGITRGLYVNPTLTAAADWRSIEWSNNSGWGLYGAGTSNNFLNGDTTIGTTTLGTATKLTVGGSETASLAIARGQLINTTLNLSANQDNLVGLDINPTFTIGAFASSFMFGLRATVSGGNTSNVVYAAQFVNSTNATNNNGVWIQTAHTADSSFTLLIQAGGANNTFSIRGNRYLWYNGGNAYFGNFANASARVHIRGGASEPSLIVENSSGVSSLQVQANQNVLIGSAVDGGQKLQVNGTAIISGADNSLTLTPTASGNALIINNNGYIRFGTGTYFRGFSTTISFADSGFVSRMTLNWGGGTSFFNTTGNYIFNGTTANASAIVQVDSTTQGFLPPRMTTTQKNAIATPAAGLIVFDTTLAKLCVYSGTAWETITSV